MCFQIEPSSGLDAGLECAIIFLPQFSEFLVYMWHSEVTFIYNLWKYKQIQKSKNIYLLNQEMPTSWHLEENIQQ